MAKKFLQANLRIVFASLCGVALVGGLGTFRASADSWDKKTVLTIREPMQVRERLLEPGTYVFKLLNSSSDRHIVQIFNQDQSNIIDTVLAIPNYRLEPTGNTRFGFWETPPGYAKALRSWFPPGELSGQEFPYPKHLNPVDDNAGITISRSQMPAATERQEVARVEQPRPVEAPAPAPQPQEVARNTPPPAPEPAAAPPAAAPAPSPAPEPPPQAAPAPAPATSLPKTATNYPAIGLGGLFCLVVFGLVRDKGIKRQI